MAILAFWLIVNQYEDRGKVREEPTVEALTMSELFAHLMSAVEADLLVKSVKLDCMAPYWSQFQWKMGYTR